MNAAMHEARRSTDFSAQRNGCTETRDILNTAVLEARRSIELDVPKNDFAETRDGDRWSIDLNAQRDIVQRREIVEEKVLILKLKETIVHRH